MPNPVPGAVSSLTFQPTFTSILLTWSAPQEPNGVIISYQVTYRADNDVDGTPVTTNTTNLSTAFTISSLRLDTPVYNVSVSAYTSVGIGEDAGFEVLSSLDNTRELGLSMRACLSLQ